MTVETLKKRKDFLRVAKGFKVVTSSIILQAALSLCAEETAPKVGYTTSKKIGKATVRNRARRRMRVLVREFFPKLALNNIEYVLIGRHNTAECSFEILQRDIKYALKHIAQELNQDEETN